jgi:hypothetical protein
VLAIALFWYGLVPILGAFRLRATWRAFRTRFDDLRLAPILDYRSSRSAVADGADYRFFGGFESITDDTLWVRGPNLTVPVDLRGTRVFLLPAAEDESSDETEREPRLIRWKEVSALSEGVSVFVGGRTRSAAGRLRFADERDAPLLVILYDGSERSMVYRAVRAGRQTNEYWNSLTPYALALGVFSQCLVALSFSERPAFGAVVSAALAAATVPLLPLMPPGLLLLAAYKRLWTQARRMRSLRDIARLPLRHAAEAQLPDGSPYGAIEMEDGERRRYADALPNMPSIEARGRGVVWRCYGVLSGEAGKAVLTEPADPTAVFAAVPGDPDELARGFSARARLLELGAGAALLAGVALNALFMYFLIELLRGNLR